MKYKVLLVEFATDIILNPDGKSRHLGPDKPKLYLYFDSLDEANAFATENVRKNRKSRNCYLG